jgi:hypothetical protein
LVKQVIWAEVNRENEDFTNKLKYH